MTQQDNTQPAAIRALMESALGGSEKHAYKFFESLIESTLFVPASNQPFPMKGIASSQNQLSDILGIEHKNAEGKEYVTVPAFFSKDEASNWAQKDIVLRELTFKRLIAILPQEWWIVIEPGGEVEKELSPWEISLLSVNPPQIGEVVSELFTSPEDNLLEVRSVEKSAYPALFDSLEKYIKNEKELEALYLIRDEVHLYAGALIKKTTAEDKKKEIFNSISDILSLSLIGNDPWRLTIGESFNESPALALFRGVEPVFKR